MLQYQWDLQTIKTNQQANAMINLFNEIKPEVGAFDTETTGLHITNDTPFLFQFGFIHPTEPKGYTFVVDLEKQPELSKAVIKEWHKLAKTLKLYLGHNVKFDLHMLNNINLPYEEPNISDTMFWVRHAHNALTQANGGPPLALKEYAARYILASAKEHDKLLQLERSQIAKELNLKLKKRLSSCGMPDPKYNAKSYTLTVIQDIFKDPIIELEDLQEPVKTVYTRWLHEDVPVFLQNKITALVESDMIPYNKLNRENLIKYAHYDIVFTIETYINTKPSVEARNTYEGIRIEEGLIYPLVRMERSGFNIDTEYLENARIKLKEYIKKKRQHLYEITGQEFTIGQHALVKDILQNDFNCVIDSTGSEVLDRVLAQLIINDPENQAIDVIKTIQELRTLEKWYSAYILRFIKDLKDNNKLYPTINSVGTVSGRASSDWQQMPKDTIFDDEGNEIFSPRKIVKDKLVTIDFSQVELRIQALYTILTGYPDLNLCRAYMPYKCHKADGTPFDFKNPNDIRNFSKFKWYHDEDNSEWEPVDVHAATTVAAGISRDDPNFKKYRTAIGKKVNFAKNYGAKYDKIRTMFPDKTAEECHKIDDAYYTAFPGVKYYHSYCYERGNSYASTKNLYGIQYYGVNGHKLINMLVQGSAAYYLKEKIKQIDEYIIQHNLKTKMIFQVHDELIFEITEDELPYAYVFKEIMEDCGDWYIPIIAEIDATKTNWAEKKPIKSLEHLKEVML